MSDDDARRRMIGPDPSDAFARVTIPRELDDPERRGAWGLPTSNDERGRFIIELNLLHPDGLAGAAALFERMYHQLVGSDERLRRIARSYYSCRLSVDEVKRLVARDEEQAAGPSLAADAPTVAGTGRRTAVFRVWPDFPVWSHVDRSIATVKADAAVRAYAAQGQDVVWAVVDSGVDGSHAHFGDGAAARCGDSVALARHTLLHPSVVTLHRCFCEVQRDDGGKGCLEDPDDPAERRSQAEREALVRSHREVALSDPCGHGTHVAGIIAGGLDENRQPRVFERVFRNGATVTHDERTVGPGALRGVAQRCRLVSLRVLDAKGEGRTSDVILALEYVRERVNDRLLRLHGVNLSVGYEYDPTLYACGQSPLCTAVDRLVQAGVVVVASAGNTGYGVVQSDQRDTRVGLSNTINDPGNAALAITVGATHRDCPHTYGVSYFSSKGPTGDGRLKPDLVAPGERITSCASGRLREAIGGARALAPEIPCYVDDSGTSMAAPHVSGAIAAFLSIRREFIGRPGDVKRIFLENATPLGRERYFEGHGLLDLVRAIQSV
jgi:serine protease AprX